MKGYGNIITRSFDTTYGQWHKGPYNNANINHCRHITVHNIHVISSHNLYNIALTNSRNDSPLSQASSIGWDDGEVVHMTRTEVVRSEGVVGLSDIGTVSTEDICWPVLICHILDEDRVPDVMINTSHIQRPGSSPGDID